MVPAPTHAERQDLRKPREENHQGPASSAQRQHQSSNAYLGDEMNASPSQNRLYEQSFQASANRLYTRRSHAGLETYQSPHILNESVYSKISSRVFDDSFQVEHIGAFRDERIYHRDIPLEEPMYRNLNQDILNTFNKHSIKNISKELNIDQALLQKFLQSDSEMVDRNNRARLQQKDRLMHPNQKREVNYCAIMIQKFVRGYLSRKRKANVIYLLKLFRIINRLHAKRTVSELSKALR